MSMTGDQAYAILKKYIKNTLAGAGALKGEDGKSAYELAVAAGFTGTLEQWLLTLRGEDGKSAYEVAVELGFSGTEEEWLESILKGSVCWRRPPRMSISSTRSSWKIWLTKN